MVPTVRMAQQVPAERREWLAGRGCATAVVKAARVAWGPCACSGAARSAGEWVVLVEQPVWVRRTEVRVSRVGRAMVRTRQGPGPAVAQVARVAPSAVSAIKG